MGFECPSCSRCFDTRRGLGVHHVRVHGERLPNRSCDNCGGAFYSEYKKKYCSDECRQEQFTNEGEANPNFRGGMETTTCQICGGSFEYYPSDKVGLYCPDCVDRESWRRPPVSSGAEHPRWSGGKLRRDCVICGTGVERYPSGFVSDVVLCGEHCRRIWLSEEFTGEGHPNWTGGGIESYGSGWNEVRERALERDGFRCVICGTTKEEIGRNPDVHHIVPVRRFVESEDHEKENAHRIENVATLCVDCHRKADFGKISAEFLGELICSSD